MSRGNHHLAMYNFGLHVDELDSPRVQGFVRREPLNFAAAERAPGFVKRSGYRGEPGPRSWGPMAFPRFIKGSGFDSGPSSLSMWADVESLMAFAYTGVHAEALKNARNWNRKNEWPPLVLWWVEAGSQARRRWQFEISRELVDPGGQEEFERAHAALWGAGKRWVATLACWIMRAHLGTFEQRVREDPFEDFDQFIRVVLF